MAINHIATAAGMLSQGISRFGLNVLIGRLGGPAVLGQVASAVSVGQMTSLIWPTANAAAASKFIPRARGGAGHGDVHAIARHLLHRAMLSTVALGALAAITWGGLLGYGWLAAIVVLLLVVGYSGQSTVNGFSYAIRQNRPAAVWDAASAVVALGSVTVLLMLDVTGYLLALPVAAAAILQTALRWPRTRPVEIGRRLRREIDIFVAVSSVGTVSSAGFYQLALVAAALSTGQRGAGIYAASMALSTPLSIVATSMSTVMFPSVAEAIGRGDLIETRRRTDQSVRAISLVIVAAAGALAIASSVAVSIVWGRDFQEAARLLPVILGGVACTAMASPAVNYLMNRSQRDAMATTSLSVVTSAVGVAIWTCSPDELGLFKVAYGFLVARALFMVLTMYFAQRALAFLNWQWLRRFVIGVLSVTAIVALEPVSNPWAAGGFALAFTAVWVGLNLRDVRGLAASIPLRWRPVRSSEVQK